MLNEKIDAFAHVLLPKFYSKMLAIEPKLPELLPFIQHPILQDGSLVRDFWDGTTRQIISHVNINAEDFCSPEDAYALCRLGNDELRTLVELNPDLYRAGIAMIPMNNIKGALGILQEQVLETKQLVGVQLFTRALGKSLADPDFEPIIAFCHQHQIPIWLHPVFDHRKPDNNIIFSWEYELSQAMMQLVMANYFKKYPNLKVIVHHAGGMIPYFAERINHILPQEQAQDFKKFYVDTALLGNAKALELAVDYFGASQVVFGTDAPLGVSPAGATEVIAAAIDKMAVSVEEKEAIFHGNIEKLLMLS